MTEKFTTEDCRKAILDWHDEEKIKYPGDFKRKKKFKNAAGEVVRIFEHSASNTSLKVVEKEGELQVVLSADLVGENFLFAFCENELDGGLGFVVVEKEFFEENGHLDSVHFTTDREMPECFGEEMESFFSITGLDKNGARKKLLELGFTESKSLEALMS